MTTAIEDLTAALAERIDRYNTALDADEDADPTQILSPDTVKLRTKLIVAALTDATGRLVELPDVNGEPFQVAAWSSFFRDMAFFRSGQEHRSRDEAANTLRLFIVVDLVRPDLVATFARREIDAINAGGTSVDLAYRERELAEVLLDGGAGDLVAIDLAAALVRRAIDRDPVDKTHLWDALRRVQRQRYLLTSLPEDVIAAIGATRQLLALVGDGPERPLALSQLGVLEQDYYDRTTDTASLRRCVAALTEALELTPTDDPNRSNVLVIQGYALFSRGRRERSPDDLDRSVALIREALLDPALVDAYRASALSMLALALHSRFEVLGRESDLADALAAARASVGTHFEEDLTVRLANLGRILVTHNRRSRHPEDLAELLSVARRGVAVMTSNRHRQGRALGLLTVALTHLAQASGRLEELNEAIHVGREAVAALADHPDQQYELHNLATALLERFRFTYSLDDLDDAIRVARLATTTSDLDDPERPRRLSILAWALNDRYRRSDDMGDLLAAIAAGEEALLSSLASSEDHAALLSNLGIARRALALRTKYLGDADAAIGVAAQAASIDGHVPAFATVRALNLASSYVVRFRITADLDDLDRAIALLRKATDHAPPDSPDRCTCLSELGQRLIERHIADPLSGEATITEALARLRTAAEITGAPSADRLRAAGRWGSAAVQYGLAQEAAAGYATAVRLLPLVAWHGLDRYSQEQQLTTWQSMVATAASQSVAIGLLTDAGELMEQGRGVLWSHQTGRRTDLDALRDSQPGLARKLEEIRNVLNAGT